MTPKRNEKVTDANEAIRQYYEEGTPLESEGSRDGTEPVSTPDELAGKPDRPDEETTRLSGGDIIAMSPPLIVQKTEIDVLIETLRGVLKTLA